jgi:predicted dehydrogenase/nucleoside-diphosphate-sugar epimerase
LADAAELTLDIADAAVICTPPFHHAPCAISLLECGLHVLVEKPMATTLADAEAMVAAADGAGRVLSVGVFRRLLPSLRMLKAALAAELLGRPLSFDLEGGAVYGWEAATLGNMLKSQAGGGILMDMGPHYFDQLLYVFEGDAEVIEYRDNALGGIESDCEVRLQLQHVGEPVTGRVELSRTRNLPNELRVICERGELVIASSERYRLQVRPHDLNLRDPRSRAPSAARMELAWADEPETSWLETFRAEIDDWVDAIRAEREPELSGRSALPVMRLIDDCYRERQPLDEPWAKHPLIDAPATEPQIRVVSEPRRVLITGATGFIGFRAAEILSQRHGYTVRAAVHNPGNASRIARLPVEMVQADLTKPDDVQRLVAGCHAVVHCAIGTQTYDRGLVFQVTVDGTKALAAAAQTAGVSRFVHLSTIAVHADSHRGVIDENTPTIPERGATYGESKLAAERAVLAANLPAVVIRPGCVYGPFGKTFTTRPIQHLAQGKLVLAGAEHTLSNTVYVDNLVEAIVRGLEAGDDAVGKVFPLADDDGLTWGQFYGFFAERLGIPYLVAPEPAAAGTNGHRGGWFGGLRSLAKSEEVKAAARKALWTDPLGSYPRSWLERSPAVKRRLKKMLGMESAAVYRRPSANGSGDCLQITPRHAEVRSDLARKLLGWEPLLTREECLERTWQWCEAARLVPMQTAEVPA